MQVQQLETYLSQLLNAEDIKDYSPNGLQVGGRPAVNSIVTGVTACQALIDAAVEKKADAILVHHGYFWKNEDPRIIGLKKQRLQTLLKNDISLLAYHLPLDVHPEFGNNIQLAQRLKLQNIKSLAGVYPGGIIMSGELAAPVSAEQFNAMVSDQLNRQSLLIDGGDFPVSKVALCTGGGQGYIEQAKAAGVDLFVSGEISEQTTHFAREAGIHYIAAGHHATERYGVAALGAHLKQKFSLQVEFVDINNPA